MCQELEHRAAHRASGPRAGERAMCQPCFFGDFDPITAPRASRPKSPPVSSPRHTLELSAGAHASVREPHAPMRLSRASEQPDGGF